MIIYQITNKKTKDIYIGKTKKTIESRFKNHKYKSLKTNSQTFLHRAIRKYGENNFTISILDEAKSMEELNDKEIFWIGKLSPRYNMTKGGEGGDTSKSPNYIKAIKKRDQSGSKNGMYGKKRNIPKKQLENAHKAAQLANMCSVSCEGKIFNSIKEAQLAFPGISLRKRLDSKKYPDFFRLKPKSTRTRNNNQAFSKVDPLSVEIQYSTG